MKKILFIGSLLPLSAILPIVSCNNAQPQPQPEPEPEPIFDDFILVADYCDSTGKEDCADAIQNLINTNPNKTLWFKDGTYLLSHPIKSYADPKKTVDFKLSNFAVLKATQNYKTTREVTADWMDTNNYMVQLGVDRENQQDKVGNNYSFSGGVIDGSGIAPAIEISGGRETSIHDCNIKNAQVGIRVAKGVNGGGSADADIRCISIDCNNDEDSVGMQVDAYDNTFSSIRMGHCNKGLIVTTTGNTFRDFHMLCNQNVEKYAETSIGIETKHGNWYDTMYVDNFRTAFKLNGRCTFNDCIAWWFSDDPTKHPFNTIAIDCTTEKFESWFYNLTCGFKATSDSDKNILLKLEQDTTPEESVGRIDNIFMWGKDTLSDQDSYKDYSVGIVVDY